MTDDKPHDEQDDQPEHQPELDPTLDPTVSSDELAERGHGVLKDILPGYAPGDEIGPFRILQVLGEGGFGVVYLADQTEPVKRRVALKVIKPGMDTKGVISRFEAERQALALMNHPGIARVYQAGATPDHRPWFAMEYVKGVPLTDYCDTQRLDTRQRLELFAEICDAIQHAHQKGIIHRDLKPGNILVAVDGEKMPSIKVIDFGIAKATSQQLTDKTLLTQQGQFIGTPEYMSPEQAEMSSLDIDTRTDVYALGVILYELLTGRLPFESSQLRDVGITELLRVIREDDPPRPSTKLSTMDAREADEIAQLRRTRLGELAGSLKRELEWIPLKALRKDRTDRYSSASTLADDVRRYLAGEPLEAGPERTSYRLQKFLRRNRGPVVAAGLLLLVLVAGVVVSTIFAVESARQRTVADEQRKIAEARTTEAEREATRAQAAEALAEAKAAEARQQAYIGRVHAAQSANKDRDTYVLRKHLDAIESMRDGEPELEELWLRARMDMASKVLVTGDAWIHNLVLSEDGETLVATHFDNRITVWDLPTGELRHELDLGEAMPQMAFLDETTDRILCLAEDHHLHSWDLTTGNKIGQVLAKGDALIDLNCHDGRCIAAWGGVPTLEKWEILLFDHSADQQLGTLQLGTPTNDQFRPRWGAFNSDGTRLAVICPRQTVQIHDVLTGEKSLELQSDVKLGDVHWSGDGNLVAAAEEYEGTCRIWDAHTGQLRYEVPEVSDIFSLGPTGAVLVDLWRSGVRFRDPGHLDEQQQLAGSNWTPVSLVVSPAGDLAVSGSIKGEIRLWDLTVGDDLEVVPESRVSRVKHWTVSADERLVAYVGRKWRVFVACAVTGQDLAMIDLQLDGSNLPLQLQFSPDGRTLAALGRRSGIHMVDVSTGVVDRLIPHPVQPVNTMAFSPDGGLLVMGLHDGVSGGPGYLMAHDLETGVERYKTIAHDSWIMDINFDPEGRRLFTASADDTVGVFDLATGERLDRLEGHHDNVTAIDVGDDGRFLASASEDATVRLWDLETGAPLHVLDGHGEIVWDVEFIPSGNRLLSQSIKSIVVWNSVTGEMMAGGPVPNRHSSFSGLNWGQSKFRGFYGYQGIRTFDTRPRVEVIRDRRHMNDLLESLSPVVDKWVGEGDDDRVVAMMEANLGQFSPEEQAALRNLVLRVLAARRAEGSGESN